MFTGPGNGYGQPDPTTKYHRTHSGEHVAERPCHAGGAVQHHVVHKESFKEVDWGNKAPANHRYFDNNYRMKANNAMAANHHGGGSHHRCEAYEETYEETREEETYAYGAARHHGHGAGVGRRFESETYEETFDEEVVVGGGDGAQLRRGYCGA